jgi:autotransporter-associated beta strand protein
MKPRFLDRFFNPLPAFGLGLCIAGMSVIAINSAAAASLSWSSTGNSTLGGTGTWDLSTPNWWNGSSGVVWTDTAGTADIAIFGGTAGTVTLGQNLGALGLVFNTTGYTIAAGANTLTLGSSGINASALTSGTTTISGNVALAANQSWNVGLGATLAASAGISGSTFGINKTGYGTLTLTGANTYTGTTTVTGGTLNIGGGTANGSISSSSPLSMGGGTLTFTRTGTNTQTFNDTAFTGGYSTVNTTVATNTLALGALSRTSGSGASVNFGSGGTITGTLTTSTANTNGILGGWATTGNAGTTAATADWVANNGSGNIVAYTGYTAVSGVTAPVSTQNWNNTAQAATTQVNTSGTVNSLKIGADFSVGSGTTLTVGSGGIILSGISRWVLNNNSGSTAGTGAITSGLASGELFVSVADALYNNGDASNWRIWTNIVNGTNPTVLVKNGPGALTLMYGSTYSGGTIINSGILGSRLNTTGAAGSVTAGPVGTGTVTINQGGAYEMHLQGSTGSSGGTLLTLSNAVTLNGGALWSLDGYSHVAGNVTVNSTGGFLGSTYSGGSGAYTGTGTTGYSKGLFIDGVLSGSGDLIIEHAGVGGNGALAEASGGNTNITGNTYNQSIVILTNNTNTYSGTITVNGSGSANNTNYLGVNGNTVLQNATVNVGGTANGVGSANWGASPILFQTSGTTPTVVGDSFTFGALTGSGNITLTEINEGNLAVGNSVALTVGGNNSSTTYSGVLSGGGSLTKAGTGTMTLSGANIHTGGTTVSAGTLKIGSATALGGNAGAASVTSGAVLDLNGITMTGTNALTLNGTGISSGGALTNSSATAGTYAGLVGLGSASSIVASNGNIILSNTGTITGSGNNLTLGGTATGSSIASIIGTGAGTVTKNGTGTWTLSGASTYTGATTINAGTLAVTGSLASGSAVAVNAGGTLAGTNVASGSSTVGGAITLAGGTNAATQGTINLANSNVETLNTGALTVGGSVGNFSQINFNLNPTTADLIAMGANAFTVNDGGAHLTITLTGGTPVSGTYDLLTFASGAGTGFATGTGNTVGALTLTNPSLTFGVTGSLNVTSTAVQLAVSASAAPATAYWFGNKGTQWSDNDGSNGNFTTDKAGTTAVTALPASTTDVIFAATGATNLTNTLGQDFSVKSLTFDATTAAANVSGANILTVGTGGITLENGNGGATLGMTTLALGASQTWANASSNDLTVSANVTGSNGLVINNTSTGKTILSGSASTYSGATAVNGGILKAGSTGGLSPNSAYTLADTAGVLLDITGFNSAVGSLAGGGASGGNVTLGAATLTAGSDNTSTTYAGVLSGTGGLTKAGTGTMTLTGTNTYTGATTVNAGTLTASGGTAIEDTSAVVLANTAGATFNLANSETVGSLAGGGATGGNVTLGANVLTTGGNNSTTTYAGAISGTGGSIIKTGSGAMTLSGVNTYDGGTTLNVGTLTAGSTTAFGATAGTLTINGGSLDSSVANLVLANNNAQNWNGDFGFTGTQNLNLGTGAVTLSANRQVTVTANTLTVGGAIAGSGFNLTKAGAGTLALLSANTYSGGSTINGGTLAIGGTAAANSGALGSGALTVNSGATLRTGYAVSSNTNVATVANDITLAGGSIFADDGFQHLSGALNVTSASTLGATYNAGSNAAAEQNKGLFLDGIVSGSANLTLQQSGFDTGHSYNTSIVHFTNAANTYSGTITVTPMAGSNTTSGGSFLGLSASTALQFATVNLNGNSAGLRFGNSPIVFNTGLGTATLGALSGSGNVVLTGYNEINHVYGADSIALTTGGNNASTTYSGVMSGGGSLTKAGSGTMTLSGLNSFTGNLTISNGTVAAGTGIAGNTAAQITSNLGDIGTAVTRSITINSGGILSLTGGNVLGTGGSSGTLAGVTLVVNSGGAFQTGANAAGAGWWNKIGAVNLNGGSIHVGSGANNTNFQGLALIGTVTVGGSSASVIDNLGSSDSAFNAVHLGQNATAGQVITFDVADVTGDASADLTVSTKLINTSSNLVASGLAKTGVGTMAISGANTYSGGTTITDGKLSLVNTSGSGTGTGAVDLSGGTTATLQGTGTASGLVTVTNASRLAPGVNISGTNTNFGSAGTLNLTGGLTLTSANLDFDLASTAAGTSDLLALNTGALSFGTFGFSFNGLGGTLETGAAYTLITTSGSATGFDANNISTTFLGSLAGNYTANYSLSGSNLQVSFTAVPEPSQFALVIAGLLGVLIMRRRRRIS